MMSETVAHVVAQLEAKYGLLYDGQETQWETADIVRTVIEALQMIGKRKEIESLIDKAAGADTADDAMKFAQAALNAANALCSLGHAEASTPRANP
jgi:hypothetical protein